MGDCFDFKYLTEEMKLCFNKSTDEININHYLNAYEQLAIFVKGLGKVFIFVIKDINSKLSQLRVLDEHLHKLDRLIEYDMEKSRKSGKLSFNSPSRSLIRLHRALLMMIILCEKIANDCDESLYGMARFAYENSMYPYHPAIVRQTVIVALKLLKSKSEFCKSLVASQPKSNGLNDEISLRSFLLADTIPILKEVYNKMQEQFSLSPIFTMP